MLGSKKSSVSVSGATTLVSRDTTIVGSIQFNGSLEVEGLVQGNIVAKPGKDALVRVLGKGRVEGEIRAPSVVINGVVQGDVYSSKQLELASKARVEGNVYYSQVEMAVGSEVNGRLQHVVEQEIEPDRKPDPSVSVTEAGGQGKRNAKSAKVD